jgi:hypothetical protein
MMIPAPERNARPSKIDALRNGYHDIKIDLITPRKKIETKRLNQKKGNKRGNGRIQDMTGGKARSIALRLVESRRLIVEQVRC